MKCISRRNESWPDRMRHIISLLVENEAGALSRISGLFSARAYNIESLTVAPTEDPSMSRMTIVTSGSDSIIEQITKQVNKLVDVIKVIDLSEHKHVERELLLIKVDAVKQTRESVDKLVAGFNARIIDDSENTCTIELADTSERLVKFIQSFDKNNIVDLVRSGVTGITLGSTTIRI
jgi:acetolactate synthase I/III small subunit